LQLAGHKFEGGELDDIEVSIPAPVYDSIDLNLDPSQNGVELVAKGIGASLSTNFTFKHIISVHG
jgi:hypothetical protein